MIRRLALVTAMALVMVGCTGGSEPETEEGEAQEPIRGGTLVVAITEDPGGLNPAITTSGATHTASELIYNGLLGRDEAGDPLPELAREWEIEEDGAVYRFHLRDDVTWHDGEPFTSADVKFTFEEVLLNFHARTLASLEPVLEEIEAPDDHTVVFRFRQPYSPLLLQLDVTEAPILPRHVFEGTDPLENPANSEPVGTGPFMAESYSPGSEVRLVRNPDYFKEGLPYLDEIVMRIIPDTATQILALEQGDVDFVWNVPGPDLERLRADDRISMSQTAFNPGGSNCVMTMAFNLERPIFRTPEVREAIALALDQQTFFDQVLFGAGAVAEAPISSGIPWAHPEGLDMPGFDPDTAARLLEESGWQEQGSGPRVARGVPGVDDGTELSFDFLVFPNFIKYGELVREQLGDVGIDARLRPLEPSVFAPVVFEKRNFDTNIISYCNGPDPEVGVRRMYHSSLIGPVPFTNAAAYSNPEVDRLFDEAARTLDRTARSNLYRRIQEILVEDLPYYWLVETVGIRAWRAGCGGFKPWTGLFAEEAFCRR